MHVTIRAEGPVHVISFSDSDQDDKQGYATQEEAQVQIQKTTAELVAVADQLKWYQDQKGILIDLLLAQDKPEKAENVETTKDAGDRNTNASSASAEEEDVLGTGDADDKGQSEVSGRKRLVSRIAANLGKGRRVSAYQKASELTVQPSNASSTIKRQRSFPAAMRISRASSRSGSDSSDSSGISNSVRMAIHLRRASTGSPMLLDNSAAASEDALLSMPPVGGAVRGHGDAPAPTLSQKADALQRSASAASRGASADGGTWTMYNSAYRQHAPQGGLSRTSSRTSSPIALPSPPRGLLPGTSRRRAETSLARAIGEAHSGSHAGSTSLSVDVPDAADAVVDADNDQSGWDIAQQPFSSELTITAAQPAARVPSLPTRRVNFNSAVNSNEISAPLDTLDAEQSSPSAASALMESPDATLHKQGSVAVHHLPVPCFCQYSIATRTRVSHCCLSNQDCPAG